MSSITLMGIGVTEAGAPPAGNFLLLEIADYILLETGDKIVLES